MPSTLELAKELIARASITPEDAGCQEIMISHLQKLGFTVERLRFGEVDNFWARLGTKEPVFAFAGHTDVVPPGPTDQWKFDPFTPTIEGSLLYGRGAADMKGSLAAMLTATENYLQKHPTPKGSIGFLITSDEEGPSINGTRKVIEWLEQRDEKITLCLVGEPSSTKTLGDMIKNGRRGSLGASLIVHGQQGHVAYPHLADNPVHKAATALSELCQQSWDQGNEFFPPTTFQISNIHAGTGADNVIPGELEIMFNFRFSTETEPDTLKKRVTDILDRHKLHYNINWRLSGMPFLTRRGALVDAVVTSIEEILGIEPEISTSGGTSDGRFIAPTGAQVVELGPVNSTIHKIDECVDYHSLEQLSKVYELILIKLLGA